MFFHLKFKPLEIYLIQRKDYVSPRFFLSEWDEDRFNAIYAKWTVNRRRANEFETEEAVENFKAEFLRHHPCEIIRIKN